MIFFFSVVLVCNKQCCCWCSPISTSLSLRCHLVYPKDCHHGLQSLLPKVSSDHQKSRGSPSGIQNAAAFPSFISYLSVLNLTAAGLALSVEHLTEERKVVGSILLRPD